MCIDKTKALSNGSTGLFAGLAPQRYSEDVFLAGVLTKCNHVQTNVIRGARAERLAGEA
jgi:hypothetical protein